MANRNPLLLAVVHPVPQSVRQLSGALGWNVEEVGPALWAWGQLWAPERKEGGRPTPGHWGGGALSSDRPPQCLHLVAGSEKGTLCTQLTPISAKLALLCSCYCVVCFSINSLSGAFSQVSNCSYCKIFNDQSLLN